MPPADNARMGRTKNVAARGAGAADRFWGRLAWLGVAAAWAFVLAAMVSYSPLDPPGHAGILGAEGVANWCGPVGAWLSHALFLILGSGAWALLASGGAYLAVAASGQSIGQAALRAVGCVMIALAVSGFHALLAPSWSAAPEGAGGLLAIAGVDILSARFGGLGAAIALALIGTVGVMVAFDRWLGFVPHALAGLWPSRAAHALWAHLLALLTWPARTLRSRADRRARVRANDLDDDKRIIEPKRPARAAKPAVVEEEENEEEEEDEDAEYVDEDEEVEEEEEEEDEAPGAPQVFDPEELRAKIAKLPVRFAAETRRAATQEDLDSIQALNADPEMTGYKFPPLDLLEDPEENYNERMEGHVREQAKALEEALRTYRIDGEVVGIDSGPVITLYEVRLAPGTKVAALNAISSDLARALKVVNVRIVPNTEGRDTVGVEAPNLQKEKVRIKELMTSCDKAASMRLPLFLGKDASGEPLVYDLAEMPHMLIAGTTGSGKSVAMNAIIVGFLYTKKPSDLKLVLVDPKMVEMSQFRDVPHLMCPVVTEMGKAAAILEWAVTKMDERYELLAEVGCRDIDAYNAMDWDEVKDRLGITTDEEAARVPRKLPRMVFIIDELADLMMTNKEVEHSIVRIAQKARAVGIHLILATQRPQANVVTGLIKSNMPSRLCFKVASGMDSRIVMDQKGGELLLGQGDMLFLSPRSSKLVRSQGTLVEDREIRKVMRYMKEVSAPTFERSLIQIGPGNAVDEAEKNFREAAEEDPLFDKAVEIIIESGRGSVSLLQRRLAIGYTRSSRLIELMGMAGIIGEHKGSVAREVNISQEEWEAMKAQAAADAAATGDTRAQASLFPEPTDTTAKPAVDDDEFTADDEEDEETDADELEDAAEEEEEEEEEDDDEPEASDDDEEEEGEDEDEEEEDDEEYEDEYEDGEEEGEEEDEEDEDAEDSCEEEDEEEEDDEPEVKVRPPFDPTPRRA